MRRPWLPPLRPAALDPAQTYDRYRETLRLSATTGLGANRNVRLWAGSQLQLPTRCRHVIRQALRCTVPHFTGLLRHAYGQNGAFYAGKAYLVSIAGS
jgi:hypothetical protein